MLLIGIRLRDALGLSERRLYVFLLRADAYAFLGFLAALLAKDVHCGEALIILLFRGDPE